MKKAVALKYNQELPAPIVIAKGRGEIAKRIEELAKAYGIKVIFDRELVERLALIELGDFIPEELYEIIAEILIFVLRLKK